MPAARFCLSLLLLTLLACGGGSDGGSPTEPPSPPVALEGTWSGTISITSPSPTSNCSVTISLDEDPQDPAFLLGNWSANCSGVQGSGVAAANIFPPNSVILFGLGGPQLFNGCGWSSVLERGGSRLNGSWSTPQNCQTGPVRNGRLDLDKQR